MKWTDKDINGKEFKPSEGQTKPRDIREKTKSGFGVTVFPSGKISFIYFYHFEGRKRRMTLGQYPECTLGEARKRHRDALRILESEDKDPAVERKKAKKENKESYTVNGLIDEYLEIWAKPRKRSWKEDERFLDKNVKPYWGKLKAKDITKRDVILLLDKIKERGAPIAANRGLACVRRMFNFAIERDIITLSPCTSIKPVAKENQRDRVLSAQEINILWHALDKFPSEDDCSHDVKMSEQTKLVLKLQLVLGQRKGEIISAEWSEISLMDGWWTIPAKKAKNGQAHRVPLSSLAKKLLEEIKQLNGDCRFLFPAKFKDTYITGTSIDHAVRRSSFAGIKAWTPHDLRRTVASHITSLGIPRLVVSKILNHVESSVTAVYDRHEYYDEKLDALERWAQKLKEIVYGVEEEKIIKFRNIR
ncbi:TPA: tyrosine-type recombinase/integrase [Legionella pneumophila]|nr:site-specific integrase [Legionella pneumophila]HAT8869205.1 tyrosine-type recombinase/integrase [Legionella pneumophila subsp. pneumophila]HAT7072030.1 tyrosine-type recombinase/integrase [Legionella pneumophila]HAT8642966.1 tyrosine-type recombinase/integrase [Legionella pneumophila]HAT8891293.1 tyrosine-type recombinase/integrase [Legionella pneumophila subsp. pneumophila]HAT8932209.1 tyrosine-type recombinase/integrase [Legionella pneumophila subsp. pneumophila]